MSEKLLMTIGGLVTDHTFRDSLFNDFQGTLTKFGITDKEILDRLSRVINEPKARGLLDQLEPYICGANRANCDFFVGFPKKPTMGKRPRPTAKKKRKK